MAPETRHVGPKYGLFDVQSSDGTWSTVQDWPHVPGDSRTMLLGRGGRLDAAVSSGSTTSSGRSTSTASRA